MSEDDCLIPFGSG